MADLTINVKLGSDEYALVCEDGTFITIPEDPTRPGSEQYKKCRDKYCHTVKPLRVVELQKLKLTPREDGTFDAELSEDEE
jgi:hypothetical protein